MIKRSDYVIVQIRQGISLGTYLEYSKWLPESTYSLTNTCWIEFSQGLITMGENAMAAANAQDEEALFKAGGEIYNVCVACHQIYWADSSRFINSDTTQSSPDTPWLLILVESDTSMTGWVELKRSHTNLQPDRAKKMCWQHHPSDAHLVTRQCWL